MLRILKRNPDRMPMQRLGEYIREFAELLGTENIPVFKGIKKASTGLKASVSPERFQQVRLRLVQAVNSPESRPARNLRNIEALLGEDDIAQAQLLDADEQVVYMFRGKPELTSAQPRLVQSGTVDGVVTGLVGADDTMHLHLRDHLDRDLRLVLRDENLARELLGQFRKGLVRLSLHGTWIRVESGWIPEVNRCNVISFETLDDTALSKVFEGLAELPGNGWATAEDAMGEWIALRGLH